MPGNGNRQPVGAHVQLVEQLVDRLLQLEDGEERSNASSARRNDHLSRPSPGIPSRNSARGHAPPSPEAQGTPQYLDGRRRVRERAEHRGDVTEGRALPPALRQRPRRLTLEVEDHPVVRPPRASGRDGSRRGADDLAGRAGVDEHPQLCRGCPPPARDRLERLEVVRQLDERPLDLLVDARGQQTERLEAMLLRAEARVVGPGGQQRVHLTRHLAEPPQATQEPVGRRLELVERHLPAVYAAGHERLHDPERRLDRTPDTRTSHRAQGRWGSRGRRGTGASRARD